MLWSKRRGHTTLARWALLVALVDYAGWTEYRFAKYLEMDHRSIAHAYDEAKARLRSDPLFYEIVGTLKQIVSPE